MKPKRIQRKRTKGWRMPKGSVYVGRPTKWGNPYTVGSGFSSFNFYPQTRHPKTGQTYCHTLDNCLMMFEWDMESRKDEIKKELKGKNLVCWCPLNSPCHADILLKIAN